MSWIAVGVGAGTLVAGVAGTAMSDEDGFSWSEHLGQYRTSLGDKGLARGTGTLLQQQRSFQPKYADLAASELQRLSPGVKQLLASANPELSALINNTVSAANSADLTYGGALPPGMQRLTNQATREGQAARGLGYGPSDVYEETGNAARLSAELTDKNRAFANDAASMAYNYQVDPFLRMLYGQQSDAANKFVTPAQSYGFLAQQPMQGGGSSQSSDIFGALMGGGISLLGSGLANRPTKTAGTTTTG